MCYYIFSEKPYTKGEIMLHNEPIDTVASRIRKAMEIRGMRQVELVEKTGLSKGLVNHYVSGRVTNAKTDKIYVLAQALNVSETWLMGYDVPMEKQKSNPFSEDNAHMVAKIRNDEPLTNALQKYFESTEDKRRKVVAMMNMMLED